MSRGGCGIKRRRLQGRKLFKLELKETVAGNGDVCRKKKGLTMSNVELKGFKELRNLNSILSGENSSSLQESDFTIIPIDFLQRGKYQPRQNIEKDDALRELADSIKSNGIIQPLIVRRIENNNFDIIAGERRWRAAKIAGLEKVPVVIRNIDDNTALAFALIENIQRENLNPIEEAEALDKLLKEFSMTHNDIANTIGRSRTMVTNTLRLLNLGEVVKNLLSARKIDMGHARALLTLSIDKQKSIAEKIVTKKLTVRETEKLVQSHKIPKKNNVKSNPYTSRVKEWVENITKSLSSQVSVKINPKGEGKLIVHFSAPSEMDWLEKKLTEKD